MRWLRSRLGELGLVLLCAATLTSVATAQTKKPERKQTKQSTTKKTDKKSAKQQKGSIRAAQGGTMMRPTANLFKGSVGYYFYPVTEGSYWKLRTVKAFYDLENKLVSADTIISKETVKTNSASSIQGLPLIKCQSLSYRPNQDELQGLQEETTYYVDDSLIMAVFNNSVNHGENRGLLVNPLRKGFRWPEKFGDTVMTEIVSLGEAVETPFAKFDSAIVTVTKLGYGELAKYFVPGNGIVKMVFRGPGGNGRGTLVVTTELIDLHKADLSEKRETNVLLKDEVTPQQK